MRICAEKLQTRKQRDEKATGRESKRTRKQKDEKSRLREEAEKQRTRKAARLALRLAIFAKTLHGRHDGYIGRFGGPWLTRIHAFDMTRIYRNHLHVYASVLDLLREVKNTHGQLSRVIPGRQPTSKKTWNFKQCGNWVRQESGIVKREMSSTSTAQFI